MKRVSGHRLQFVAYHEILSHEILSAFYIYTFEVSWVDELISLTNKLVSLAFYVPAKS